MAPEQPQMSREGLARLFRSLDGHLRCLPSWASSGVRAVWLGLLDADDLNAITRASYESGTGFESAEFNLRQGLWPWEETAFRGQFPTPRRLLVAGAGGGREAFALAREGHAITAFDSTPALVVACRRHATSSGLNVEVLQAEPDAVPEGTGRFEGLVIGRGCYHHIPGRARRVAFLRACHAHLNPGSPMVLLDFHERSHAARGPRRIQRIAGAIRWLRRSPERVELGDWLTCGWQHAFTQTEMEAELIAGGFRPLQYLQSPFGPGSHLAHALGQAV
jgi:SAM-dependent methyltransferase